MGRARLLMPSLVLAGLKGPGRAVPPCTGTGRPRPAAGTLLASPRAQPTPERALPVQTARALLRELRERCPASGRISQLLVALFLGCRLKS